MKTLARLVTLCLLVTVPSCGGDDGGPGGADGGPGTPDGAPGTPDAAPLVDLVDLITGTWTIPAGSEQYWCARLTVSEDVWISEFHPIIPLGTHHTVLTVDNPGGPADGEYACSVAENGDKRGVYGTGVGANPFVLPAGVAMKIAAGEQLVLNLHLFNTDDVPLDGVSGTRVKLIDPADVVHEADSDLVGKIFLIVPPGTNTQTSDCTVSAAQTVFAVSPHMHQLGVHARAVVNGGAVTLVDTAYSFEEQLVYSLPSDVELSPGDTMTIDCSYNNTTGATVYFGDSSNDEMCFLGVYRYPAGAFGINCN